jgi:rare lipoprotein A
VVVGQPYQIGNVTFVPSDSMNFDSVGYASVGTEGGSTISAAHHTLPVPSYAEVTDINTGRTILVRVERRGPMDSAHAIELSPGAAAQLGVSAGSNTPVRVRRVNPAEAERAMLRSGNPAPERMATPKPLLNVLQRKLNPALAQRALDNADKDAGPNMAPEATPKLTPAATQPSPLLCKACTLRLAKPRPTPPRAISPRFRPPSPNRPRRKHTRPRRLRLRKLWIARRVKGPSAFRDRFLHRAGGRFFRQGPCTGGCRQDRRRVEPGGQDVARACRALCHTRLGGGGLGEGKVCGL